MRNKREFTEEDLVLYEGIDKERKELILDGNKTPIEIHAYLKTIEDKLHDINNLTNIPIDIYRKFLPYFTMDHLLSENKLTLDFTSEINTAIISLLCNDIDIANNIIYYLSENLDFHESVKYVENLVDNLLLLNAKLIETGNTIIMQKLVYTNKILTSYFPDEILEVSNSDRLTGHMYTLYKMNNQEKLDEEFLPFVKDCMVIAIEADLPFATSLLGGEYIK